MNEKLFNAAIDAIYDAGVDPDQWPLALARLSACFGSSIATVIDRNIKTEEGRGVAVGVDAASQIEFFSVWGRRNPFVQALHRKDPRAIDTDQTVMLKDALLKSDYYNGFMRQRDMHAMLRFTLAKDADSHQSISIMSPRSRGEFEAGDLKQAGLFLPHLERVAKLGRHMTVSASLLKSVSSTLDLNPSGIILLNRRREVIIANKSACAMANAGDSFLLRRNKISAVNPKDDSELQRVIASATGMIGGLERPRGDAIRLSRANGQKDHLVVVTPLNASKAASRDVPVACITINDVSMPISLSPVMLKTLFGMTPTESRIAERLASGATPAMAADALGIALSTARTHIDSMFRKTEVSRQIDLVRLLAQLRSSSTRDPER